MKEEHTKQIDQLTKNFQKKIQDLESQLSASKQSIEQETTIQIQELINEVNTTKSQLESVIREAEKYQEESQQLYQAAEQLRMEKELAEDNEFKSLEAFMEEEKKSNRLQERIYKLEKLMHDLDIPLDSVDELVT